MTKDNYYISWLNQHNLFINTHTNFKLKTAKQTF